MKLSIVVPIYKRVDEIKSFFENISNQTSKDFELIIILDANKEKEINLIIPLIKKEPKRFKLIFNTKRRGYSKTINTAFKDASGEYVLIINTSDKLKSKIGVSSIISEIKKANNPDILEFPLLIRGILRWNPELRVYTPKATKITEVPNFIAKTMPTLVNKVFKKEKFLSITYLNNNKNKNSKFIFETLYSEMILIDDLTVAVSKSKLIKVYISKYAPCLNPTTLSKEWKSIFSLSDSNDHKYFEELLYASLFHKVIFISKLVFAYKVKIMTNKNWKNITDFFNKWENELKNNTYILFNSKENKALQNVRTLTELKKIMKDF
ncbi:MAG: glycosyltransferase family 2 protein [Mycoplasma sp.]|nr:glycosyltransferase family 2 protein [Mycoplasma sp.]